MNFNLFYFLYSFVVFLFISRLLVGLGLPANIAHAHLLILPFLSIFYLAKSEYKFESLPKLLIAVLLTVFLVLNIFSGLINDTGLINVFLNYLLLTEGLLFFYFFLKLNYADQARFKGLIIALFITNLLLVAIQFAQFGPSDDVKGLLINLGNGHHVTGAITILLALYLFHEFKDNLIIKISLILTSLFVIYATDAKQVSAALIVTAIFSIFVFAKSFSVALKRFIILTITASIFYLLLDTLFQAYTSWSTPELLIEGFIQKNSVFSIFFNHASFTNYFLGFGPGTTASRLALLINDYPILGQIGAFTSPMFIEILDAQQGHWTSNTITGSSMFSLFNSISGLTGDLGLLGLLTYAIIWSVIFKYYAQSDMAKIVVLFTLTLSSIFLWFEEPQFMVIVFFTLASLTRLNQTE